MYCNLVVQTEAAGDFEAKLTLFGEYLAIQRVRRLVHCINMTNFLTFLLGQSFKKVCGCLLTMYSITYHNGSQAQCVCNTGVLCQNGLR